MPARSASAVVKARHVRFDPRLTPGGSHEDRLSFLVQHKVTDGTLAQYDSRLNVLGLFICAQRGLPSLDRKARDYRRQCDTICASCTREEYVSFLTSRVQQGSASAEGFRSALQLLLVSKGDANPWTMERPIVAATKGVEILAAPQKIHKGSITPPMMVQLIKACGTDTALINAFAIAYHAALRNGEFMKLRVGDLQRDSSTCSLKLREAKVKCHQTKPVTTDILPLWDAQSKGKVHGTWLFPLTIKAAMEKKLADAAVEYGWPYGVAWTGTHVLRIGGDVAIAKKVAEQLLAALTQQTPGVLKGCLQSNEERLAGSKRISGRKRPREESLAS